MANAQKLPRNRAACRVIMFTLVGFIVWLDLFVNYLEFDGREPAT
jgi:hypothetical protein